MGIYAVTSQYVAD